MLVPPAEGREFKFPARDPSEVRWGLERQLLHLTLGSRFFFTSDKHVQQERVVKAGRIEYS